MNNQEKGLAYEKFVKDFIKDDLGKVAFLWNECPENILIEKGLIDSHNGLRLLRKDLRDGFIHTHRDIGIDVVLFDGDHCAIVQCKNGYSNGLCVADIAGIMMRSAFSKDLQTFIYYTDSLSRNIVSTSRLCPSVIHIDCSRDAGSLKEIANDSKTYFVKKPYIPKDTVVPKVEPIVPHDYQCEASQLFAEHFKSNRRGILAMPPGTGKTCVAYMIAGSFKHVVILSPLREFASQNMRKFCEYGYDSSKSLLVDADGIRDIDSIKDFIRGNQSCLISCTYKSMDLVSQCLDLFSDALFIIDEFHNLSRSNISDDENDIFKLLMSDHKILSMSATPRIYEVEYDEDTYDMQWLLGDVVYQMNFTDAIDRGYITDYRIWLPSVHENNEKLDEELSIYDIENDFKDRSKFLFSCIANNGSRKCIIYCIDTEDMHKMMKCAKTLNDFYAMNIDVSSISCGDSEAKRKDTLSAFSKESDRIQLLFNIRILNECIDIPACDSVYISYPPTNKISTIQRMCRAVRKDAKNPNKVANIYIWCSEYDTIMQTLSSIKEYDLMFEDKMKMNSVDFYASKNEINIDLVETDKKLLHNCVIGVKEFRSYTWYEKLVILEKYVSENGKLPSQTDKDVEVRRYGQWINTNNQNYVKQKDIMRDDRARTAWRTFKDKHSEYFKTNEEKWFDGLSKLQEYIELHNELPSTNGNEEAKKLSRWLSTSKKNFPLEKCIMAMPSVRLAWCNFIETHSLLFESIVEKWRKNLQKLVEYINSNDRLPSLDKKDDKEYKIANWLHTNKKSYSKKINIMNTPEIYDEWTNFIVNYHQYCFEGVDKWRMRLKELDEYIQLHNKLPSTMDENPLIKSLASWCKTSKNSYDKNLYILKTDELRREWEDLVEQHKELFINNKELWYNTLYKLEEHIISHNRLPTHHSKDPNIRRMGKWCQDVKSNYNKKIKVMRIPEIREAWIAFTGKYSDAFLTDNEKWYSNLAKLIDFIEKNESIPKKSSCDPQEKKLTLWMYNCRQNYKDNAYIMKNHENRLAWESFVDKYGCFL